MGFEVILPRNKTRGEIIELCNYHTLSINMMSEELTYIDRVWLKNHIVK